MNGEIGFWIAKDYWNRGYMTEALKLMTSYIFEVLKYHRVHAYCHELNNQAKRVLVKARYKSDKENPSLFYKDA